MNQKFADYFAICGLDEVSGLESVEDPSSDQEGFSLSPLHKRYKANVLSHYPDSVENNPFDTNGTCMMCLPKGVRFLHNSYMEPKFHTFLLTREDGSKVYGCVLTFYEQVKNDNILAAMQTLFAMHETEVDCCSNRDQHGVEGDQRNGSGDPTLFIVDEDLCTKTEIYENSNSSQYHGIFNPEDDMLLMSKCICLIMQQPHISAARTVLFELLENAWEEANYDLPLESQIFSILYEVPAPPAGRTVRFYCGRESITTQNPTSSELPLFDYSLKEVFNALGVENVVDLFTCILLEHQVLLLSSDLHKLMLVAEALTTLVFPLLWQHVYVPILPANLLHFLDAPVPFIMGLFYETEQEKDNFDIPLEGSLCLLDIDSNMVELPEEIPDLPHRSELIDEVNAMCVKFGVDVPRGSIWLRQGTLGKGKEDVERSSSNENLESDLEASYEKPETSVSTPRKSSLVPYRGRSDSPSFTNSLGRNVRRSSSLGRRSKSKSPLSSRRYGNDILEKMKPRKISTPQGVFLGRPREEETGERIPQRRDLIQPERPDSALANLQLLDVRHAEANSRSRLSPSNSPKSSRSSPDAVKMGNPRLAAIVAIAEKAGLDPNTILKKKHSMCVEKDVDVNRENLFTLGERAMHVTRKQQHENEFNIAVREIFVNRFTQMLVDYESFVILPKQNKDDWLSNRENMHNFDKAAFLSDQSATSLPFLTLFVETQGFASLIDMKVMTLWENSDPRLAYFDKRIDRLKVRLGIIRATVYEKCTTISNATDGYLKRCNQIDHTTVQPHALKPEVTRERSSNRFPMLQGDVLSASPNSFRKSGRINWRRRDKKQQHSQHLILNSALKANQEEGQRVRKKLAERVKQYMQESQSLLTEGALTDNKRTLSAFADRLLKECKIKTKRLVVLKLGQEAVELGHGEQNSAGIEENTLIASLCDLLERVWSHGVQLRQLEIGSSKGAAKSRFVLRMRQSKSALWSHLIAFQRREELSLAAQFGIPEDESVEDEMTKFIQEASKGKKGGSMEILAEFSRGLRRGSPEPETLTNSLSRRRRSGSIDLGSESKPNLDSPKLSLSNLLAHTVGNNAMDTIVRSPQLLAKVGFLCDLKMVQGMKEIKTDTGYARAWTRLALEKKVLADQLKQLLSDKDLLETRYKGYAFIRTEEEMEQFLYHLLSLNAVEFFCFTNGFVGTNMTYKVSIAIGKHIAASTTANRWMKVSGSFGDTGVINIPKGEREFRFQHVNRGILTTLRIGHDNTGISPGWFIEHVTITNEVTGHVYRFPCGRWLSRNQDDCSTERLLVAESYTGVLVMQESPKSQNPYDTSPVSTITKTTPTHKKLSIAAVKKGLTVSEIQERLADAVNSLVKYFFREKEESLTYLLCADGGFCQSMELVFQYGFKSSRLFGKNMFVWEYIEKVQQELTADANADQSEKMTDLKKSKRCFCVCVHRVNSSSQSIGKDERFQVWLCLGLRDHMLQDWFYLLSKSKVSRQMYETRSFILDDNLLTFLIEVLDALTEFDISLDVSITRGVL